MDAHRNFPEEPRWYGTGPGYGDDDRNLTGGEEQRYADDTFRRVPEPRTNRDPRYDGLTDTHERSYGTPGGYGELPFDSTPTSPYEPSRRTHDTGTSGFETIRPYADPVTSVGPRSGEPLPPLAHSPMVPQPPPVGTPPPEPHRMQAEPIDRAALRRGPAPAAPVGEGVYRTRRPMLVVLLAVAVTILELPALRLLLSAAFGENISVPGVIGGTLLIIGLPLFALGVHGLVTGAATPPGPVTPVGAATPLGAATPPGPHGAYGPPSAPGPPDPHGPPGRPAAPAAWQRPPLAYLVLGVAILVAAALAAA